MIPAALLLTGALLAQDPDGPALTVRFLDDEGAPIPDVELVFTFGFASSHHSGEDGRVRVPLPPTSEQMLVFEARAEGFAREGWANLVEAGDPWDLGDVTLSRGGTIVGRIVDPEGNTVGGTWTVEARGSSSPVWRVLTSRAQVDPEVGEFRLEHVLPGRVEVVARNGLSRSTEAIEVEVELGVEQLVELTYGGPDPTRSFGLRLQAPACTHPATVDLVVVDAQGTRDTVPVSLGPASIQVTLHGLGRGPYRVEVEDPRFVPVSARDLAAGTRHRLRLEGTASLALEVVDLEGAPLPWLRLALLGPGASPVDLGGRVGATTTFSGLLPGTHRYVLHLDGRPALILEGLELPPGRTTRHRVVVDTGSVLTVVVQDGEGRGLRDVQVEVRCDLWDLTTRTDAQGRVGVDSLSAGSYEVIARPGPAWSTVTRDIRVEGPRTLVLTAPATGWLVPELELPPALRSGPLFGEPTLRVRPIGRRFLRGDTWLDVPLEASGHSPVPLPVGDVEVMLHFTRQVGAHPVTSGWNVGRTRIEAGRPTTLPVDLSASYPARVTVRARVDGVPASTFELKHVWADYDIYTRATNWSLIGEALPGERSLLIGPGSHYVSLAGDDATWVATVRLDVGVAETRVLDVEVTRIARRLRFVEATTGKAVLPDGVYGLTSGDLLVEGPLDGFEYAFSEGFLLLDVEGYRRAEVHWSEDLPDEVVVELTPR